MCRRERLLDLSGELFLGEQTLSPDNRIADCNNSKRIRHNISRYRSDSTIFAATPLGLKHLRQCEALCGDELELIRPHSPRSAYSSTSTVMSSPRGAPSVNAVTAAW